MATTVTTPSDPQPVQTTEQAKAEYNAALTGTNNVTLPAPEAPPVAPQPLTVPEGQKLAIQENADGTVHLKLSTGEEFTGTPLEVSRKMAESKVDTTLYAKDLKAKLETATPPVPAVPTDVPP